MIDKKIEDFLEKGNMTYLFCLLSNLEAHRINNFPSFVKQKFDKKITVLAMEHVADNEVPDYVTELEEAERIMAAERAKYEDDEGLDFSEETIDDSARFVRELEATDISEYDQVEVIKDPFAQNDNDLDEDFDDDLDDDDDDDDDDK
nr:hypothetical protein [Candidatus Cloacimonadota bacterium]